jgi:sugar diacid utilization regulator
MPAQRKLSIVENRQPGLPIQSLISKLSSIARPLGSLSGVELHATHVQILDEDPASSLPGAVVLGVGLDSEQADAVLEGLVKGKAAALLLARGTATEQLRIHADKLGLPLLELRSRVGWTEAYRAFETILEDSDESPGIEDLLHRCDDLPELAKALSERLGNPLTIENLQSEVLAYSEHDEAVDAPRRKTILAGKAPSDLVGKMQAAGVFRKILQSAEPVPYHNPRLGITRRVAMTIREGQRPLGYIWVMQKKRKLTKEDLVLLRQASRLAAFCMARDHVVHDNERRLKNELLMEILSRGITAPDLVRSRAAAVGLEPERAYEVLVVRLDEPADKEDSPNIPVASRNRVYEIVSFEASALEPDSACVAFGDDLVVVVPSRVATDSTMLTTRILERCRNERPPAEASIGRARTITDISNLADAFDQAERALLVAQRVLGGDTTASYDDLGVYKVLVPTLMKDGDSEVLATSVLALDKYDAEHGTEYARTLEVFLDTFGDRAETSRRLCIHHNTLSYRLQRIQQMGEFSLDDSEARLSIQLEFRARKLRDTQKAP